MALDFPNCLVEYMIKEVVLPGAYGSAIVADADDEQPEWTLVVHVVVGVWWTGGFYECKNAFGPLWLEPPPNKEKKQNF
eukprot:3602070-Amphidinium_carterae.1